MRCSCWATLLAVCIGACGSDPKPEGGPRPSFGTHVDDWRDEVIYQIVVDRFDNGDRSNDRIDGIDIEPGDLARHQGGDFQGVHNRLDYLQELGATTLWLSPVVANVARTEEADGYHGYWASDFTTINRRFGTVDELRALVDEAHARGMHVILDVVINHAGAVFFYDLDQDGVLGKGEAEPLFRVAGPIDAPVVWAVDPPTVWRRAGDKLDVVTLDERDFHRRGLTQNWSSPDQIALGDFPTGLRDLSTDEAPLMQALVDTYVEWVRLTDVDGFRLDAAPHVHHADWASFCTSLRERLAAMGKTRFMLLGEVFRGDAEELASYTAAGEFDSVFDFTLKWDGVDQFLLEGGSALPARYALEAARAFYPAAGQEGGLDVSPWQARVVFGDNHDMERLRGRLDDQRAVAVALALLFTVDGIPALYYGTEQGFNGVGGHTSREVLWDSGFDQNSPEYQAIRLLSGLRREHPALRYGDLIVRYGNDTLAQSKAADAGLLAYERVHQDDRLLVVLNARANGPSRARMNTGFRRGTRLVDMLGSNVEVEVGESGDVEVELAQRSALLLVPR